VSRTARHLTRPALALLALCFLCSCEAVGDEAAAADAHVTIRGARVAAEVVVSLEDQQRGLGYRDSLAWHHGMLFEYERPAFLSFWMKGMRFDIDIVWIREGRVVGLSQRVPHVASPDGPWPPVRVDTLSDAVLEVPAGYASAHGWRVGDRVTIERRELPGAAPSVNP
jgi:uncharacterized membrane protein (UPF0127 family)